jgi:hypothetical protein
VIADAIAEAFMAESTSSASISIRVLASESGLPVAGAHVAVCLRPRDSSGMGAEGVSHEDRDPTFLEARTHAGGLAFLAAPLAAGEEAEWLLVVRAPGRQEWMSPSFRGRRPLDAEPARPERIRSGERAYHEVRLERSPTLAGTVAGPDGQPLRSRKGGWRSR